MLIKNRVRRLASFVVVFSFLAPGLTPAPAQAAGTGWYNSFEEALAVAKREHKPIFADFSTSWCGVCKQMDRSVFTDPNIIARLQSYVTVKVDGDARGDLCSVYGVSAYPTFVEFDPSGRVMEKHVGYMGAFEMAGTLDQVYQKVSSSSRNVARAGQDQSTHGRQAVPTLAQTHAPEAGLYNISNSNDGPFRTGMSEAQPHRGDNQMPVSSSGLRADDQGNAKSNANVYAGGETPDGKALLQSADSNSKTSLKDLAEATAKPASAKNMSEASADQKRIASESEKTRTNEISLAPDESTSDRTKAETRASDEKNSADSSSGRRIASMYTDSPTVGARIANLSSEELPKPLLSRSSEGSRQTMQPATVQKSSVSKQTASADTAKAKDPLATIRKVQSDPAKSAQSDKGAKTVAMGDDEKAPSDEKSATSDQPDTASTKTPEGATASDINRWMSDADSKLVAERKKEARAMYEKVVEKDPKNQFGHSDTAFVKMVALSVDQDDDALRKRAYSKIKEFEARYPESKHKDYYTLIRATLAADLGDVNSAHRLLETYANRFPNSNYKKVAYQTWKSLPPIQKGSSKKSSSSDDDDEKSSSKSKRSSADNSSSKSKRSRGNS